MGCAPYSENPGMNSVTSLGHKLFHTLGHNGVVGAAPLSVQGSKVPSILVMSLPILDK